MTKPTDAVIEAMLEAGESPDTAGSRSWPNWKVRDALLAALTATPDEGLAEARPLDEWHEDMGDVVWWKFPITEAAMIGNPLDSAWPDYHTHWTPHPPIPAIRKAGKA